MYATTCIGNVSPLNYIMPRLLKGHCLLEISKAQIYFSSSSKYLRIDFRILRYDRVTVLLGTLRANLRNALFNFK